MFRKFLLAIAGIVAASSSTLAHSNQQAGLMVFCRVYVYQAGGGTNYFTPVFYLEPKAYNEYMNWDKTKSYEDMIPDQLSRPGSYYADAIDGQFYAFMSEGKSGLLASEGDCRTSTDATKIREWRKAQRGSIDTQHLKDWRPVKNWRIHYSKVEPFANF
jgi:hypothetical protein